MKKILLSCFLIAGVSASAQVTGSKTIGIDYPNLAAAFADLNSTGVGVGGAILNVPAGYAETAPSGGFMLGSATLNASLSAANPLFVLKSGAGANPVFTAQVGTSVISATNLIGDAIFNFSGVDYMTIDGLDLKESAANTDATTLVEKGFAFYNLSGTDGANYNTVQNCSISFLKTVNNNAIGVFFGHNSVATPGTAVIPTTAGGTHSNNKVYSNTFTKSLGNAINFTGYAAPTPFTLYDQNNDIGGSTVATANMISDFGGLAGGSFYITSYAIYAVYQNNANVSNNNIQFATDGLGTVGIYVFGTNSTFTTNNNTINAVGSSYTTTSVHTGIYSNAAGTNLTARNNKINITSGVPFSGAVAVYGILFPGTGSLEATGNTIVGGNAPGIFQGIYSGALVSANISNNSISGLNSVGSASNVSGIFMAATATSGTVSGNKIYNLTANGATGTAYGLNIAGTTVGTTTNIFNNLIGDIKTPAVSSTSTSLAGIYITASGATSKLNAYYNTINLSGTSSGANFSSTGIYHTNSATATTAALDLRNNIISNSTIPKGTGNASGLRRSAAGVSNYASTSNNNNLFGTTATYWNGTAGNTLAQLQALGRDANSFEVNPSYLSILGNADFLKLNPADLNTQILDNKGAPIAGYSTDYALVARDAVTPDMGAYEFTYVAPTTVPSCTVVSTPADLSTGVTPNPVVLNWVIASGATSYKLMVGTATGLSDVVNATGITTLSYSVTLSPNTQYFVKVTATNSIGDAVGCTETSFTTGNVVYCIPANYSTVEPTTNVTFGSINNTTSATVGGTPSYENFTTSVAPATINRESVIPISLNANTDGAFSHFFAVFIDWNKDGDFDDANEKYFTTEPTFIKVTNSNGITGTPATGNITVPADALLGQTRMRVKSAFYAATGPNTEPNLSDFANACVTTGSSFGQVEDYTIEVDVKLGTSTVNKNAVSVYPNPFTDVLNISDVKGVKSISIHDVSGRQVKSMKATTELNLSELKTGLYIVNLHMEDGTVRSIKAIKK